MWLSDYRIGQQHIRFWLEWDRGTMNVRDLAIKFASYVHYLASREWAKECALLPRYHPGRANVACCSEQTGACFWYGGMDDNRGALARVWSSCGDLVAAYSAVRSREAARCFVEENDLCSGF